METILPLLGFAVAASVTPGPNTLMVSAMAAAGGLRGTLPALLGISLGFMALLLAAALGLAAPLAASPPLQGILRYLGVAWLLYLAWKIGRAPAPVSGAAPRGFGFWGAAGFQWVNPKAWMVALAAIPAFAQPGEGALATGLRVALVFGAVSLPCLLVWVAVGRGAGRLLRTPRAWRRFNLAMGLLLAASVLPLLR